MGEQARARLCDSSGSEHSPEDSAADLSDLVNSFIETEYGAAVKTDCGEGTPTEGLGESSSGGLESQTECFDSETEKTLRSLLAVDDAKRTITAVAEQAYRKLGNSSLPEFKRRLMTRLRDAGFDAGLCKSRWAKGSRIPAGSYDYVDVNVDGTRYIVEAFLAGEFEIARPTQRYASLLEMFPTIFVGEVDELKQVVGLMCAAMKSSLKSVGMHVPPWRRNAYMQAKWFGSYKRTLNSIPARSVTDSGNGIEAKRSIGFVAASTSPRISFSYHCRDGFVSKVVGVRGGLLAAALNGE